MMSRTRRRRTRRRRGRGGERGGIHAPHSACLWWGGKQGIYIPGMVLVNMGWLVPGWGVWGVPPARLTQLAGN